MEIDDAFLAQLRRRDRKCVARAISVVEDRGEPAFSLLQKIHAYAGHAWRIGITGAPGAGKSTLTNALAVALRRRARQNVAIIAVDPTSPFTAGAVLGDRVRMVDVDRDPEVFIRSMGSRGRAGGLSAATQDAADVLDAAGYDVVLIESVGVGQVELDIRKIVDTTLAVLVPESGDQIQAIKAGLMEIADCFVLNKCDLPGASHAARSIRTALGRETSSGTDMWHPRMVRCSAGLRQGIDDLLAEIDRHRSYLTEHDQLHRRRAGRIESRIRELAIDLVSRELWDSSRCEFLSASLSAVQAGERSPQEVARQIVHLYRIHSDV